MWNDFKQTCTIATYLVVNTAFDLNTAAEKTKYYGIILRLYVEFLRSLIWNLWSKEAVCETNESNHWAALEFYTGDWRYGITLRLTWMKGDELGSYVLYGWMLNWVALVKRCCTL